MTCSVVEGQALSRSRRQVFLGLFIAIAVSLHAFESLLPTPVPWLRLGLANVMTLVALYLYDGRAAWTVSLARVGIGALLLGRIFGPGFWLALVGTLFATSAMIIVYRVAGRRLSPIGISAIGAGGHALGQILAARLLVVQHAAVWQILPFFLLSTLLAGVLTGWLAALLLEELREHPAFQQADGALTKPMRIMT
jgi:heptaprenyl diphosphate synthase